MMGLGMSNREDNRYTLEQVTSHLITAYGLAKQLEPNCIVAASTISHLRYSIELAKCNADQVAMHYKPLWRTTDGGHDD